MAQSQFCLSWEEYRRNICNGLSSLQQNGEFVDMTLAADGHLVKVHQVIVALASPYLKELIASVQCPHPVIFLNKISYTTLCAVLEYIYTGEVLVSMDHLNEFIDAGRELHIRGLADMKLQQPLPKQRVYQDSQTSNNLGEYDEEICYFEISNPRCEDNQSQLEELQTQILPEDVYDTDTKADSDYKDSSILSSNMMFEEEGVIEEEVDPDSPMTPISETKQKNPSVSIMQYTVSNQGSLQMILNRFVYYLKHTNVNSTRQWRCVDYVSSIKCPAHVITKADMVLQRVNAHTHPFHDKKILKKVRAGSIFSAIQEAEREGSSKKKRLTPPLESKADIE